MNPWKLFELVWDILLDFSFLSSWRFGLCLLISSLLAVAACEHISASPLRWIVAGVIVLFGMVLGNNWEKNS